MLCSSKRADFGADVGGQPFLAARRPGRSQSLDHRRGQALVEHAAQQLPGDRGSGRAGQDLHLGAERREQPGVGLCACPGDQHGRARSFPGDRGHQRDVGHRDVPARELADRCGFSLRGPRYRGRPRWCRAADLLQPSGDMRTTVYSDIKYNQPISKDIFHIKVAPHTTVQTK